MENNNSWVIPVNLAELPPIVAIFVVLGIIYVLTNDRIFDLLTKYISYKKESYQKIIKNLEQDIEFLKNENLELKKEIELIKKDYKELLNNHQGLLVSIAKQDQHLTEIDNKIS